MLVDSHAHLDMLEDVDGAIARAAEAGVNRVVTIGVDVASSEWAVAFAGSRPSVWATVGLHPHDAKDSSDEALAHLAALATDPRVVGVGETGLDYHYDHSPREQQRASFRAQIEIAARAGKALVIHTRDAWEDTFAILSSSTLPEHVVFHCWSGGPVEAERALALGAVLSFSGIVTFPSADTLRAAAALAPPDRILIETDSPFLTPVPYRGKKNEPAYVELVARELARVKEMTMARLAAATTDNAERIFGL